MKDKQIIIVGGGKTIQEGVDSGLWDKLKGKCTFGLNYSYNYFESTIQMYVDLKFYKNQYNDLAKLPLVVGQYHNIKNKLDNTIMIRSYSKYDPTLQQGAYKASLCGLFALTVAIYLQPKEIFLLGYDYGSDMKEKDKNEKFITHFYQGDINHRGIGKINYYTARGRAGRDFDVYADSASIINNVSLISTIPTFQKISYTEFFSRLDNNTYSQDELREIIKSKLKEVRHG